MRRSRTAALTGILLLAGGAGAGTASADPPSRASGPTAAVDPLPAPRPELERLPRTDRQRGPAVPIPEADPRSPGPLPIPLVEPRRPGPVPMPRLDGTPDVLPDQRLEQRPRPAPDALPSPLESPIDVVVP